MCVVCVCVCLCVCVCVCVQDVIEGNLIRSTQVLCTLQSVVSQYIHRKEPFNVYQVIQKQRWPYSANMYNMKLFWLSLWLA